MTQYVKDDANDLFQFAAHLMIRANSLCVQLMSSEESSHSAEPAKAISWHDDDNGHCHLDSEWSCCRRLL